MGKLLGKSDFNPSQGVGRINHDQRSCRAFDRRRRPLLGNIAKDLITNLWRENAELGMLVNQRYANSLGNYPWINRCSVREVEAALGRDCLSLDLLSLAFYKGHKAVGPFN